jgi:hypothetical protein
VLDQEVTSHDEQHVVEDLFLEFFIEPKDNKEQFLTQEIS